MKGIKPNFDQIHYNPQTVTWGKGNAVMTAEPLAVIRLQPQSKAEQKREQEDYLLAQEIYEKYINQGQLFIPCGKDANKNIRAKITHISFAKQTVNWVTILSDEQIEQGYQPSKGKYFINTFIQLFKSGQIDFI